MAAQSIKTPLGEVKWVNIEGEGKDNFNEDGKIYTVTIVYPKNSEKANKLQGIIDAYWDENKPTPKAKAKSLGYYDETAKDDEGEQQPTGNIAFVFNTNTTFPNGDKTKVAVLNRKGDKVSLQGKKVGNGSVGVVHGALGFYSHGKDAKAVFGVSLYLKALQLATLIEYVEEVNADEIEAPEGEEGFTGAEFDGAPTDPSSSADSSSRPEL